MVRPIFLPVLIRGSFVAVLAFAVVVDEVLAGVERVERVVRVVFAVVLVFVGFLVG